MFGCTVLSFWRGCACTLIGSEFYTIDPNRTACLCLRAKLQVYKQLATRKPGLAATKQVERLASLVESMLNSWPLRPFLTWTAKTDVELLLKKALPAIHLSSSMI
jgi:hypothetical protein